MSVLVVAIGFVVSISTSSVVSVFVGAAMIVVVFFFLRFFFFVVGLAFETTISFAAVAAVALEVAAIVLFLLVFVGTLETL